MGEQFDASRPIYAQLVERLKARILAGTYPPGGHLDSVRDLAAAAGVNPNTMQRALAQLETEAGAHRTHRRPLCYGGYCIDRTASRRHRPDAGIGFSGKDARHRLQSRTGSRAFGTLGHKGGPQ